MIIIAPVRIVRHYGEPVTGTDYRPDVATGLCYQDCFGSSVPPPEGYGQATQATLNAEIGEAPQMLNAEQQYQPQLTDLASNDALMAINNMLYGSTGQQGTIGDTAAANSASRAANINDVQNLGPSALTAVQGANPAMTNLLTQLNQSASAGLSAGSSLTPDQQRAMQQQSRAAFAARGTTGTNGSVADELLRQFNLGQQLLTQRQQFGQSMVGTNMSSTTDPMLALLGGGSSALPFSLNGGTGAGFNLFNPQAGTAYMQANNAQRAQVAASQPSTMQDISSVLGVVGDVVGGIGSAYSSANPSGGSW